MDVTADEAVGQCPHSVDKDVPADRLDDVLHELRTVAFNAAPLFLRVHAHVGDAFAAKAVSPDAWLHIGKPPAGRQSDEQHASRMQGYATARQNGWMSANDIRELENLDRIPAEDGGDLYLINGNMLPLASAGAFANTTTSREEEDSDEEVLEVDEPGGNGSGSGGTDAVPERHHRGGKLV